MKRVWVLIIGLMLAGCCHALDLELTQGMTAQLPIGIDSFGSASVARSFTDLIQHDLSLSGQFKMIPAVAGSPVMVWRSAGADSLVKGTITPTEDGRYAIKVSLIDTVAGGRELLSRDFQVRNNEIRTLAHYVSDLIYEKLIGERGIFSTRIAYVLAQTRSGHSRYSLEVADADGYNPQSLLTSPEPIMSPAWSPDGSKIACVSFEKKRAQIYIINVETGERRLVTSFEGINNAPAWSPDGKKLAVVLSREENPKIYEIDLQTGKMKQLTFGPSIDTEPKYSPDGKSILFTSGRGGSPQIYQMGLKDGQVKRLTFDGNYNARASYTPNRAFIVMLHRGTDRQFTVAAQNLIDGRLDVISGMGTAVDEAPSIAPNGRLVLYATRAQDKGLLEIASIDGRIHLRLPAKDGDVQEPAWSPFL